MVSGSEGTDLTELRDVHDLEMNVGLAGSDKVLASSEETLDHLAEQWREGRVQATPGIVLTSTLFALGGEGANEAVIIDLGRPETAGYEHLRQILTQREVSEGVFRGYWNRLSGGNSRTFNGAKNIETNWPSGIYGVFMQTWTHTKIGDELSQSAGRTAQNHPFVKAFFGYSTRTSDPKIAEFSRGEPRLHHSLGSLIGLDSARVLEVHMPTYLSRQGAGSIGGPAALVGVSVEPISSRNPLRSSCRYNLRFSLHTGFEEGKSLYGLLLPK